MKTKLLLFLLFTTGVLQAQVNEVVSGLNTTGRLIIDGSIIYTNGYDRIATIDVSANTPIVTTFFDNYPQIPSGSSGLVNLNKVIKYGNTIIAAFSNDDSGETNLTSIDISNPTTAVNIITGRGWINGLAIKGDELYFTEFNTVTEVSVLNKIDLTVSNPPVTTVLTGLTNPQDLEIKGNIIYIGDKDTNQIQYVDIAATTPTLEIFLSDVNARGLHIYGDYLYFSNAGNIDKVHLSNAANITRIVSTNNEQEFYRDAVVYGNKVYMPIEDDGKIYSTIDAGFLTTNDPNVYVINVETPRRIIKSGTTLYVLGNTKIYSIDTTIPNPTPTLLYTATNSNHFFVNFDIEGNTLYVSEELYDSVNETPYTCNIFSLDVTNLSAGITQIYKSDDYTFTPERFTYISALTVSGNNLYFTEEVETSSDLSSTLYKVDTSIASPTPSVVVSGYTYSEDIELYNDIIYIVDTEDEKIYTVDTTLPSPSLEIFAENIVHRNGLGIFNDVLYLGKGNQVFSAPINATTPATLSLITENNTYPNPRGGYEKLRDVAIIDDTMYIPIEDSGFIYAYQDANLLSNKAFSKNKFKIITGTDKLTVLGLNEEDSFSIFNIIGQKLNDVNINHSENTIDISSLNSGIYILNNSKNKTSYKFIKR